LPLQAVSASSHRSSSTASRAFLMRLLWSHIDSIHPSGPQL
jgi:hypothetical protein